MRKARKDISVVQLIWAMAENGGAPMLEPRCCAEPTTRQLLHHRSARLFPAVTSEAVEAPRETDAPGWPIGSPNTDPSYEQFDLWGFGASWELDQTVKVTPWPRAKSRQRGGSRTTS